MLFILINLSSCKEEFIPAYIHIPSISVATVSSEGSSSSNITDAWVYLNANLQGVYELPVQFPIIAGGNTQLVIYAGIKLNGISATRAEYPLYSPDTIDLHLERTVADTIHPMVKYSPLAVFNLIEDFETGSNFSNIQSGTADVFEGGQSGRLQVNDSSEVTAMSNASFTIPYNTRAVFFEMNYKNNREFFVGIQVTLGGETFSLGKITVTESNEWNKLYVNFTPEVNESRGDSYRVFLLASAGDPNSSMILFDNLKLVHARIQ